MTHRTASSEGLVGTKADRVLVDDPVAEEQEALLELHYAYVAAADAVAAALKGGLEGPLRDPNADYAVLLAYSQAREAYVGAIEGAEESAPTEEVDPGSD